MRGIEHIPWLYDAVSSVMERLGLARWRRWLSAGAEGATLEVGCGTGRNLALYPESAAVIGSDPDPVLLRTARRRAPGIPLVAADAQALPFRDGAFDTVVSSLVFCSVPDPGAGLQEIGRVLGPDGTLRMLEHVRSPGVAGAWVQDRVQPLWTWLSGGCHPNRDTESNVRAAGFRMEPGSRKARRSLRRFVARPGHHR